MGLNVVRPEPTGQPEAVAAGLEGHSYARDFAPRLHCFIAPAMQ